MNYLNEEATDWLQLFIGVVIVLCATAIGGVAGFEHRSRIQREIDAQPKARPVVQNPPPFLIGCDRPAVEEVSRLCRARMRSGRVGG